MAVEIERKFLLSNDSWKETKPHFKRFKQAYFCNTNNVSIRVRITHGKAWISFKSATREISRFEYEYPIPENEAEHMIQLFSQGAVISKTRYFIPIDQHIWEIDVFEGDNEGLCVAEIELKSENEPFSKPDWLGEEVSQDVRYFNCNLVDHPYKEWGDN